MDSTTAIFLVYGFAFYTCTTATALVYCVVPPFRRLPAINTVVFLNLFCSHLLLSGLNTPELANLLRSGVFGIIFEEDVQYAIKLLLASLLFYTGIVITALEILHLPQHNYRFTYLGVLRFSGTIWAAAVYTAFLGCYMTL